MFRQTNVWPTGNLKQTISLSKCSVCISALQISCYPVRSKCEGGPLVHRKSITKVFVKPLWFHRFPFRHFQTFFRFLPSPEFQFHDLDRALERYLGTSDTETPCLEASMASGLSMFISACGRRLNRLTVVTKESGVSNFEATAWNSHLGLSENKVYSQL